MTYNRFFLNTLEDSENYFTGECREIFSDGIDKYDFLNGNYIVKDRKLYPYLNYNT